MDDMILLVDSKKLARRILETLRGEIEKEKISLNPKSCIVTAKNGIEFLGWRFTFSDSGKIVQKVKRQSKRRMFFKCREIVFMAGTGKKQPEDLVSSIASYRGHLLRGNGWRVFVRLRKTLAVSLNKSHC